MRRRAQAPRERLGNFAVLFLEYVGMDESQLRRLKEDILDHV